MTGFSFRSQSWLLAIGLIIVFFFCIAPPTILSPTNLAWIGPYDPAVHYLGWALFQNSPWSWPLGLNPDYGMQISSSIVYSDAIPLFAFVFKALKDYLPTPFQYFGFWYLICLLLQCVFAFVLIERIVAKQLPLVVRLLLVSLFAFAPILLWRIGEHAALSAHFVLLAAFALIAWNKPIRSLYWVLLLMLTSFIHFYLLLMLLALWAGSLLDLSFPAARQPLDAGRHAKTYRSILLQVILAGAALFATLWIVGYFVLSGGASTGNFGVGRMNVLAIFNPQGWSYLLGKLPERAISSTQSDAILSMMEGYNYFGLGIICLIPLALWGLPRVWPQLRPVLLRHRFLVLSFVGLTILAISNNVSVGPWNLQIPLPQKIYELFSIVRASGRMFWPVWYALVLLMIWIISRAYSKKLASIILVLACLIQIADTSAGWLPLRQRLSSIPSSAPPWIGFLKSPFWVDAAKRYQAVEVIPLMPGQGQLQWQTLGAYAAKYHLKTNAVYLARVDAQKVTSANQETYLKMRQGQYDPNTVYILGNEMVIPALMHLKDTDLLARIDGMNVLAPGWRTCQECVKVDKGEWVRRDIPRLDINQPITFSKNSKGSQFLVDVGMQDQSDIGWSYPESFGVWLTGERAILLLPIPEKSFPKEIVLNLRALISASRPIQELEIFSDGQLRFSGGLIQPDKNEVVVALTRQDLNQGFIKLEFVPKNRASPKKIGIGDDDRKISIGLNTALFQ
jgi:hypothetical protein